MGSIPRGRRACIWCEPNKKFRIQTPSAESLCYYASQHSALSEFSHWWIMNFILGQMNWFWDCRKSYSRDVPSSQVSIIIFLESWEGLDRESRIISNRTRPTPHVRLDIYHCLTNEDDFSSGSVGKDTTSVLCWWEMKVKFFLHWSGEWQFTENLTTITEMGAVG